MKAMLVRDLDGPNPKYNPARAEHARQVGKRYLIPHSIPKPKGTIIDDPEAFKLVQNGVAIPHDDECRIAAGMTAEQMAAAQQAYQDLEDGTDLAEYFEELEAETGDEDAEVS